MKTLTGLYVITDETLLSTNMIEAVQAAIDGGARIVQYRDKTSSQQEREQIATELLALCQSEHVLLLINDDVALAKKIGAHGVHLGKEDMSLQQARNTLGKNAIIGVSCYNQFELAETAAGNHADYIAFGRFFPSKSKPHAIQADIKLISRAHQQLSLPVCVIGGITPENAPSLLAEGADMLAVIQGVFSQPDIKGAALQYTKLFINLESSVERSILKLSH